MPPALKQSRRWFRYAISFAFASILALGLIWIIDAILHSEERRQREFALQATDSIREQIAKVNTAKAGWIHVGVPYHSEQSKIEANIFLDQMNDVDPASTFALDVEWLSGTDEFLAQLRNLEGLHRLLLLRCEITVKGMESIAAIPNLDSLNIYQSIITDREIEALKSAPVLTTLSLAPFNESDLTIPAILTLPHLRNLTLYDFPAKWFAPQLNELKRGTMLKELTLVYVDPATIEPLRAALPDRIITAKPDDR